MLLRGAGINNYMEKKVEIINGFPIKNFCVMCDNYMDISWANYVMRGNFCQSCNAKCTGKGILKTIKNKIKQTLGQKYY